MAPAPAAESVVRPPDGGWGWVVVFGAFISIGFSYAMPKAITVFFHEIQDDFLISSSEIAWIASIMLAAMYAGGPLSSMLVTTYGSRPVVMLGGVMCWVSMVTASFGDSIAHLYVCIGLIGGLGLSFNLNASLTIISKYFLDKRPLANGIAMAGSPVFLCFLAPLNQYLLSSFGWRGSLLIIGAMMLNCCVAGALMRPVTPPNNPSISVPLKKVEEQSYDSRTELKRNCMKNLKRFLDFSLFKHRGFVIYLIGNLMFFFGAYAPIVFLSAYAVSQDISEYSAAYLLSIMGFVDMFVRPGTGLLANTKWIRPRIQYFLSFAMVFTGACHLVCPLGSGYAFMVCYTIFFGIGFGMVFGLIFECLMDLMGSQRFPSAVGLVTIIECCPMLLGPPTAGRLRDITGDYKYLFIMCGSVILTGGVFLFVMNIYNYHMLDKERTAKDMDQNHKSRDGQDQEKGIGVQPEEQQPPKAAVEWTEPEAINGTAAQGEQMRASKDDLKPESEDTPSKL